MTKRMLIDASHAEETRVVVLDGNRLEDFDLEAANRLPLKGNIYLAKVVRVEPSLQAAFVEYGGNRHGFLPLAEIHPDYYQIPVADRQRLLAMQAAEAREEEAAEEAEAASDRAGADASEAAAETVNDEGDADRDAEAGRTGGSEGPPAETPGAEPSRDEEPEPVLVAPPPVESAAEPAEAPASDTAPPPPATTAPENEPPLLAETMAAPDNEPPLLAETMAAPDNEPPPIAETAPAVAEAATASPEPSEAHASGAEEPAPSGEAATIAEQSGPFLLPGEGDQPSVSPAAAAAAPNGRADDAEGLEPDDAPPPEEIGGEAPEEVARERRGSARFMRHYKIQEVIKRRQIMLVQVVKEERGTKGAALTTFISLAGRFSVLMPNSPRGGGVSRKITSATDRRRLREVIDEVGLPDGMSLIVRTAGAQRPKPEIRRDCEYLLRLWDSIRERTLASSAPALIYEEADLIKRSIRDNYARDVEEILVDGEDAYREAREFMRMLMPQHAQKIQLHRDGGLFARHGVEAQLDAMHSPVVQLRSGGYIVINQTEALVSIDVNSGRSTRERHIEDTAFRTNMEAADEIARQLRLRDLAGLIVIDFIDMESNRHDATVERRLKEALRHDRARIQVGRISHFGLLEMSRQRLRPSLAETAFVPCPHCGGLGQVRSLESSALTVLRAIEEEGAKRRAAEIAVHVASPVALYLLNRKRDRLARIEARFGMSVVFEPDDALKPPALRIDRLRVADPGRQRAAEPMPSALRMDYAPEPDEDDEDAPEAAAVADAAGEGAAGAPPGGRANGRASAAESAAEAEERAEDGRRRRRRRRRRGGRGDEMEGGAAAEGAEDDAEAGDEARADSGREPPPPGASAEEAGAPDAFPDDEQPAAAAGTAADGDALPGDAVAGDDAPRRRRRRRGGGRGGALARAEGDGSADDADAPASAAPPPPRPAAEPPPRYSGPTPADPFAGHVDDIMAAMEAAEAAAEAAAQAASTLAGRRARMAPPLPAPAGAEAPGSAPQATPAEAEAPGSAPQATPAEAEAPGSTPRAAAAAPDAEQPASPAAAAPVADAPEAAPAAAGAPEPAARSEPVPAAAPGPVASEPVQGPPVQPRSVDEVAADAPRRSGWWRR